MPRSPDTSGARVAIAITGSRGALAIGLILHRRPRRHRAVPDPPLTSYSYVDDVKVAYCPMVQKYWLRKGETVQNP